MISVTEVREVALSLPGAVEVEHMGKPSFRMNNKIFLVMQEDLITITVKISKEERNLYVSEDPVTYRIPEGFAHLNYMHICLETAPKEEVFNLIRSAWGSVAPKKAVKAYFER
ncbi:MmcQ/YjbR family DNA-binding protein [Gorillibacterium sp. sgz5001074]|uniref:MmcQ/YjbR family DNA-binding protein n=1 Tax=Gorillibacterium sp. sgz5001074 TaxID=3446695 RepID=UPI003F67DF50